MDVNDLLDISTMLQFGSLHLLSNKVNIRIPYMIYRKRSIISYGFKICVECAVLSNWTFSLFYTVT